MNSEKVKEIKKIADFCMERGANCSCCAKEKETDSMLTCRSLMEELLDLINELESENKGLAEERDLYKKQFNELEPRFFDLRDDNKQIKDRIAELEKVYDRQVRIINDLNIEVVKEQEKLPKFAERLFEKYSYDKLTHEPDEDIEIHLTASELDETLKEFLND